MPYLEASAHSAYLKTATEYGLLKTVFFLLNIKATEWQLTLETLNIQKEPLFSKAAVT